ncbi:hypothetical protein M670_03501 [Schinkia azotoformans MEV2011]|uniref:Uncharacterized protein n=1 Tax=Schinkia azotoformans MEV2011 TaxID=1348973 RepID=A0A072NVJ2_SCHAZ|nr:YtzI protein [Schinkia azotoformans]KEF37255.1 hypothetical protein M670_03501 [Schinkia azotoformans MEV2011]MEC1697361.1 YtzI protein [Schinkia azotoformans]MEC1714592.1 YtzI protein [Schinkia azotoformans]MEC1742957.1 YtzI protein [Schinkia azotoformans]MEC1745366.1 YtzI protein [Schinkia azotoformans]
MSYTGVIIFSVIIAAVVIGLTIWVTNKAYEVLPSVSKVDPLPNEKTREISENTRFDWDN